MDGIEDGCMIYRLIVIKHKGVYLLQNRENRSQLTGIINPNKSCFGLESRPSNKNICKDIESIIGQGTLITKENVHNQDIVVGSWPTRLRSSGQNFYSIIPYAEAEGQPFFTK